MKILTFAAALLLLSAVDARSIEIGELKSGAKIRIREAGSYSRYVLRGRSGDTLQVAGRKDKTLKYLPLNRIGKMEVQVRRSTGGGMLRGALYGGAGGAVIGMIYGITQWGEPETNCGPMDDVCEDTASSLQLIGAVGIFGLGGIVLGMVIGAVSPGMTWEQVNLPLSLSIGNDANRICRVQFSKRF